MSLEFRVEDVRISVRSKLETGPMLLFWSKLSEWFRYRMRQLNGSGAKLLA